MFDLLLKWVKSAMLLLTPWLALFKDCFWKNRVNRHCYAHSAREEKTPSNMVIQEALPFPFTFRLDTIALIVIDMQRDFVEPGGFGESLGNDVTQLRAIIPTVQKLIEGFRQADVPVIHTMECHDPSLIDCPRAKLKRKPSVDKIIGDMGPMGRILIAGEYGTAIIPECEPLPGELVIQKPGKGAFFDTNLEEELLKLGVKKLVFAGVTTEVCVQTTMREATDRGFECLLVEDATASYFPEFKKTTLEMIRAQAAIVGHTALANDVTSALLRLGADALH